MAYKKSQQDLVDWTKEDWGTASGKKSSETGERYLPRDSRDMLGGDVGKKRKHPGAKKVPYTEAEKRAYRAGTIRRARSA